MLESFYEMIGRNSDPIEWWQMCIRAIIIFLWALALYRAVPRRAFGNNAAVDIVVVVIMGSALSRALTGNSPLLPTIAATALLALLYSLLVIVSSRVESVSRLVKGRSIQLVSDGRVDWQAMREAQIGMGDLREALRQRGVARLEAVEAAYLERNGNMSVIRKG